MLTAQQLRAVIQQDRFFKRAESILKNDWQVVNDDNPLARQFMTVDDLQFALSLQAVRLITSLRIPAIMAVSWHLFISIKLILRQGREFLLQTFK